LNDVFNVKLPNIIFSFSHGIYEIKGLELNINNIICKNCFDNMKINNQYDIQEYRDVQCSLCKHKHTRSMDLYCWEGSGCASYYNINDKKIYSSYGSIYVTDIIKIYPDKFMRYWENIDINKRFIICDECIKKGLENKIIKIIGSYI
jgi:uncharacterized CHY-type Zn-finger protein